MRPLLFVLLAAASATAQPVASRLESVSLPAPHTVAIDADGTGYRAVVLVPMATAGSLIGSSLSAIAVVIVASSQCGLSGCSEGEGNVQALAAVSGAVGGTVGAAMVVGWMSATPQGRSFFPSVEVGRGDWRRALAGAAVGTVPGLLATALSGGEPGVFWLAVPIGQGVGAGLAVALRER